MKEERARDLMGIKEYQKYIKEVEERVEEQKKRDKVWAENEFENYRREHATTNFATFYDRV